MKRGAGFILLIAIATVVGGLLLVRALQDRLIFFPQVGLDATPAALGLPFEEVSLTTADGETIAAWFVAASRPGSSAGTVLFLHGNAGNRSHRLHAIDGFVRQGFSILLLDYRGYGGSSGDPTGAGLTLDAETALSHLAGERGIAVETLVFYGESIGSVPALRLVRRLWREEKREPAALVLEGAFTTALEMGRKAFPFLPVSWLLSDPMDNLEAIRDVAAPTLFIHGTQDEVVPFTMGRRLHDASPARMKEFRAIEGAGHNDVWLTPEGRGLFGEMGDFLRRALARER